MIKNVFINTTVFTRRITYENIQAHFVSAIKKSQKKKKTKANVLKPTTLF